jgi:hypothetical protein
MAAYGIGIATLGSLGVALGGACGSSNDASNGDAGHAGDGSALCDGARGDALGDGGTPSEAMTGESGAMKGPIVGLIDMGQTDFDHTDGGSPACNPNEVARFPDSFDGIVINLTWAELQPTSEKSLTTAPLDAALALVKAYNAATSNPLVTKLRISGGFVAPRWAQALGGAPLSVSYTKTNGRSVAGTLGRWWTSDYIAAWRNFQEMLAKKYDSEPLIREVAVTSCAANTDEPFVPLPPSALPALHAAGFTDSAQLACLSGALEDYAAWKTTPIDFTFNAFAQEDSTPLVEDPDATVGIMKGCTNATRCILATHYLDNPLAFKGNSQNLPVYAEMLAQSATSTTDFQTAAPVYLDWCGAIDQAIAHNGLSVELWSVGKTAFPSLSAAEVANLARALRTRTSADAGPCPPIPKALLDGG